MKKIKISHEVPFCLLEDSLSFNDMQYALPHLLESNEEYNFYIIEERNTYFIMCFSKLKL